MRQGTDWSANSQHSTLPRFESILMLQTFCTQDNFTPEICCTQEPSLSTAHGLYGSLWHVAVQFDHMHWSSSCHHGIPPE